LRLAALRERGGQEGMGVGFDETKDATRRTRLANERTYLAWWRTGLTCLAVAVGVGRIVPGVSHVTNWPYQVIGVGYGIFGIAFMVLAHLRVRKVERAVDRGEFARMDERISFGLLASGVALGIGTIALILFET
jgi:putative membrane protein